MNFILLILITPCLILNSSALNITAESILKKALFVGYDKTSRPSDRVDVSVKISLRQIIGLNEKTQIITTSSYLFVYWADPRLMWNPADYGGTDHFTVLISQLWLPDLYVINTADSNGFVQYSSSYVAYLFYNGMIYMNIGLVGLNTRCAMDIYVFPYDQQTCSIVIGSWFQDQYTILINQNTAFDSIPSTLEYTKNTIWKLVDTNVSLIKTGARFLYVVDNYDLYYNITIKRQPLYYLYNNVYPCLILNFITIFTFFFPFNLQAGLTLTTFLNQAIISVRVSGDIPVQSVYLPLISLFFFLSIFYTFLSFIWFIAAEQFKTRKYAPKFIQNLASKIKNRNLVTFFKESKDDKQVEIETTINYLNNFACFIMVMIMFTSYLTIWLIISAK